MANSGKSGQKLEKNSEKWEKWGKVVKSGEKLGKVGKMGKSGEKWGKMAKSGKSGHFGFRFLPKSIGTSLYSMSVATSNMKLIGAFLIKLHV